MKQNYQDNDKEKGRLTGFYRQLRLALLLSAFLFSGTGLLSQTAAKSRLQKEAQDASFQVFPNPSAGKFTVAVKDLAGTFDINVYNLIGEMVYHWESGNPPPATLEVDLSRQPGGVYLVELDTEQDNLIKKVVLDHEKGR